MARRAPQTPDRSILNVTYRQFPRLPKLRHTFASILVAGGEDPASVMAQLGHTDPKFILRVCTHVMRRDPPERERLKARVYGETIPRIHRRVRAAATRQADQ